MKPQSILYPRRRVPDLTVAISMAVEVVANDYPARGELVEDGDARLEEAAVG